MAHSHLRILHLIQRLSLGGAGRSLIAAAARSRASHRLVSLLPPDPAAAKLAHDAGIVLAEPQMLEAEISASEVLQVHFWNTPELYAALRKPLPACRMVLTSHVLGSNVPHVLTDELRAMADLTIATSPATQADRMIPAAADFTRLRELPRRSGDSFTIGFVGTLDFAKLHSGYIAMHAAIGGDYRVLAAGTGPAAAVLRQQAQAAGIADRFSWLGWVEDVAQVLGQVDVFGYPLHSDSFATSELVLHEAMAAGCACVVLASEGAAHIVTDGETGFVVRDGAAYAERIRQLRAEPALRLRLGEAAARHARANLGAQHIAPQLDALYGEVLAVPRKVRSLAPVASGEQAWLRSLGAAERVFSGSLAGDRECDLAIIAASPVLASADSGGVLHYRRAFPRDAALRYWSGLVLLGQERFALAAGEFKGALEAGFDEARCRDYLRRAIAASRSSLSAHQ